MGIIIKTKYTHNFLKMELTTEVESVICFVPRNRIPTPTQLAYNVNGAWYQS